LVENSHSKSDVISCAVCSAFDVQKNPNTTHSQSLLIQRMGSFVGFRSENLTYDDSDSMWEFFERQVAGFVRAIRIATIERWQLSVGRWTFTSFNSFRIYPPIKKACLPPRSVRGDRLVRSERYTFRVHRDAMAGPVPTQRDAPPTVRFRRSIS